MGTRWCVDSYGLIRLSVLRQTGLYPNIYGAEKVLVGELSLFGPTHQIPQYLFKQRIHKAASAYQNDSTALQQFLCGRDTKPFASTRLALLFAHLNVCPEVEYLHLGEALLLRSACQVCSSSRQMDTSFSIGSQRKGSRRWRSANH